MPLAWNKVFSGYLQYIRYGLISFMANTCFHFYICTYTTDCYLCFPSKTFCPGGIQTRFFCSCDVQVLGNVLFITSNNVFFCFPGWSYLDAGLISRAFPASVPSTNGSANKVYVLPCSANPIHMRDISISQSLRLAAIKLKNFLGSTGVFTYLNLRRL
jgi:hypothetical protein